MNLERLIKHLTVLSASVWLGACLTTPAAVKTDPAGPAAAQPAAVANAAIAPSAKPVVQNYLNRMDLPRYLVIPSEALDWKEKLIYSNVQWSGDVVIRQPVVVGKTGTLTIEPGAHVYFDLQKQVGTEEPPWILVQGKVNVLGKPEKPVVFSSVSLRDEERTDFFSVQSAKEARFHNAIFERGGWGIHLHETAQAEIVGSTFRDQFGGVRFKSDGFKIEASVFERTRIGIRMLDSKNPRIALNSFKGNLTGVFVRQAVEGAVLEKNSFDDLEYDVKLGEGQTKDVTAAMNWWKAQGAGNLAERIYDSSDSPGLGRVIVDPVLAQPDPEAAK